MWFSVNLCYGSLFSRLTERWIRNRTYPSVWGLTVVSCWFQRCQCWCCCFSQRRHSNNLVTASRSCPLPLIFSWTSLMRLVTILVYCGLVGIPEAWPGSPSSWTIVDFVNQDLRLMLYFLITISQDGPVMTYFVIIIKQGGRVMMYFVIIISQGGPVMKYFPVVAKEAGCYTPSKAFLRVYKICFLADVNEISQKGSHM